MRRVCVVVVVVDAVHSERNQTEGRKAGLWAHRFIASSMQPCRCGIVGVVCVVVVVVVVANAVHSGRNQTE